MTPTSVVSREQGELADRASPRWARGAGGAGKWHRSQNDVRVCYRKLFVTEGEEDSFGSKTTEFCNSSRVAIGPNKSKCFPG